MAARGWVGEVRAAAARAEGALAATACAMRREEGFALVGTTPRTSLSRVFNKV